MEFVVTLSPSFGGLYPLASLWRLQNIVPIKIIDHREGGAGASLEGSDRSASDEKEAGASANDKG